MDVIVDRCAGLDVHKDSVMACVRRPDGRGGREQEVREFSTFRAGVAGLRDWLVSEAVSQVAMEATGVYWHPVWDALEPTGVEQLLCNAHHVKQLPGRKTDVADAAWLAQLLECGLLRGSFVPPKRIGRLRDLTRYRKQLIQERSREIQRLQKALAKSGAKLDSVVSSVMGVSARKMLDALIAGDTDGEAMAEMAKARLRSKLPELRQALDGGVDEHARLMLSTHLVRIDELDVHIARLDREVEVLTRPFRELIARLVTVPGIGLRTAEVIIAETGGDMAKFRSAAALASWTGLCPGNNESAHKRRSGRARQGNQWLRTAMCEAAWAAVRVHDTYFQSQYRHLCRRFGKGNQAKAVFAVAHSMIIAVWHLLAAQPEPGTGEIIVYRDLGSDWFDKRNDAEAQKRRLVKQLEQLGHRVTLQPAA